jgi:hypothetical protein
MGVNSAGLAWWMGVDGRPNDLYGRFGRAVARLIVCHSFAQEVSSDTKSGGLEQLIQIESLLTRAVIPEPPRATATRARQPPNTRPVQARATTATEASNFDFVVPDDGDFEDAPANTRILVREGVYNVEVYAKDGQEWIAENAKVVFDGQNQIDHSFISSHANNVVIEGFEIRNYAAPAQRGAIERLSPDDWFNDPIWGPGGWTVRKVWVHHNAGAGIVLSRDGARIEKSVIEYNGQIGVKILFGSNQVVVGNTIRFNNPDRSYDPSWEAGGTKFWDTRNLTVTANIVHDNQGPGLWADFNNENWRVEFNTVFSNSGAGIFHEIGRSAVIRENTIINNGHVDGVSCDCGIWERNAGIFVANSGPVTVKNNYLRDNQNGIAFVEQDRVNPASGKVWPTSGVVEANNTVLNSGESGSSQDYLNPPYTPLEAVIFE